MITKQEPFLALRHFKQISLGIWNCVVVVAVTRWVCMYMTSKVHPDSVSLVNLSYIVYTLHILLLYCIYYSYITLERGLFQQKMSKEFQSWQQSWLNMMCHTWNTGRPSRTSMFHGKLIHITFKTCSYMVDYEITFLILLVCHLVYIIRKYRFTVYTIILSIQSSKHQDVSKEEQVLVTYNILMWLHFGLAFLITIAMMNY